jgi:hypothetical protein
MRKLEEFYTLILVVACSPGGDDSDAAAAGDQPLRISQLRRGATPAQRTRMISSSYSMRATAVDLSDWSCNTPRPPLNMAVTTLPFHRAGGYYLIQEAQGAGGTTPLPTPDAIEPLRWAHEW